MAAELVRLRTGSQSSQSSAGAHSTGARAQASNPGETAAAAGDAPPSSPFCPLQSGAPAAAAAAAAAAASAPADSMQVPICVSSL